MFLGVETNFGKMTDAELVESFTRTLLAMSNHIDPFGDEEGESKDAIGTLILLRGALDFAQYVQVLRHYGDLDKLHNLLERLASELTDD